MKSKDFWGWLRITHIHWKITEWLQLINVHCIALLCLFLVNTWILFKENRRSRKSLFLYYPVLIKSDICSIINSPDLRLLPHKWVFYRLVIKIVINCCYALLDLPLSKCKIFCFLFCVRGARLNNIILVALYVNVAHAFPFPIN